MAPSDFVQRELGAGRLRFRHIAEMTRFWQAGHGLPVDGLPGRRTVESIEVALGGHSTDAPDWALFQKRALAIALAEEGQGEDPKLGNNRGAAIYKYRRGDGTGRPWDIAGPWCAAFASWCLMRSAEGLGYGPPFKTSRGAKRLTENVAAAGRRCAVPEPGALICWHRSRLGRMSRKGHVAFVVSYDPATDTLVSVDGNKLGRGERWADVEQFTHPRGRWRRGLYLMATMAPRPALAASAEDFRQLRARASE
jgi:hypothetical protein